MLKIVFMDAGNGGKDSGAVGNGLLEKTIALNLTNHVGEILQKITKGFPEIQSNN